MHLSGIKWKRLSTQINKILRRNMTRYVRQWRARNWHWVWQLLMKNSSLSQVPPCVEHDFFKHFMLRFNRQRTLAEKLLLVIFFLCYIVLRKGKNKYTHIQLLRKNAGICKNVCTQNLTKQCSPQPVSINDLLPWKL